MQAGSEIVIRPPQPCDKAAWLPMFLEYAVAVESSDTDPHDAGVLWEWLMHGTHRVAAFFAFFGGELAGFAVYRPFPRTLNGNEACYLDDLFVARDFRGLAVAERLIEELKDASARNGWTEVRWVTTPNNQRARNLYDRIAVESDLLTYRLLL